MGQERRYHYSPLNNRRGKNKKSRRRWRVLIWPAIKPANTTAFACPAARLIAAIADHAHRKLCSALAGRRRISGMASTRLCGRGKEAYNNLIEHHLFGRPVAASRLEFQNNRRMRRRVAYVRESNVIEWYCAIVISIMKIMAGRNPAIFGDHRAVYVLK